ncbi:MAG: hypothetical protein ACM31L_08495 [Actinomycetota bacterium]
MERWKRFRRKRQAEGWVQVRVWVPAGDAQAILDIADELRPEAETDEGEDGPMDGLPTERQLSYAEQICRRYKLTVPPPILRSRLRLMAWIRRNRFGPSDVDIRLEQKRLARIAKLRAELEELE